MPDFLYLASGFAVACLVSAWFFVSLHRSKSKPVYDFAGVAQASMDARFGVPRAFRARDGASLFFRQFGGDGNTAILILHGSGSESGYLSRLATGIVEEVGDVVVYTPDLRGHGKSHNKRFGDCGYVGQLTDDLDDLVRYVSKKSCPRALIVIGHSLGASLALKCVQQPEFGGVRLAGLVLIAPYFGLRDKTSRKNAGGWIRKHPFRLLLARLLEALGSGRRQSAPVISFNRPSDLEDGLQAAGYSFAMYESLASIKPAQLLERRACPALVLVGADDEVVETTKLQKAACQLLYEVEYCEVPHQSHLGLITSSSTSQFISEWVGRFRDPAAG